MATEKANRTGYITAEQKETLIEFMKKHPELKSGKFSAIFTAKDAQKIWMELTDELHKIPNGAVKEWKQWRKTWQDLCSKTKVKNTKIKTYMQRTGGGPSITPLEQLTPAEEQVLETLDVTAINGHENIAETGVSFNFENAQYLEDEDSDAGSATMDIETIDEDAYTISNKENNTYNMQELNMEQRRRMINMENKTVMPTYKIQTSKNTILKNKQTRIRKIEEGPSIEKEDEPAKEEIPNKRNKGTVATQRLAKTMEYTNDLVHLTEQDQKIRKKYYRKKVKLMKKDIAVKEKIITALENLSNAYNIAHV